ncbi:DUF6261 family protein [Capnocytophaga cynodegmi]|uniref:DUF6261 family protein n=1 Tax=Capnocytophaga cynodegmi TaxID=28189 RepID=UPI00385BF043
MKNLNFNVRITEAGDVAHRLVVLYKEATDLQNDEFLKTTFTELENQADAITEAVKRDKAVSKLKEADNKRDEAIRILDKLLKAYEVFPIENIKVHGVKVFSVFKKYGVKMIEENYSSKSNLTNSLLKDLSATEFQASISELLGVSEAIEEIRTTQEKFAKVRSQYEKEFAENLTKTAASKLRKPLLGVINKNLIPYLVAMTLANGEKYTTFTNKFSKIINDMNEVVKSRAKKK